jgi:hypothetical protein
MGGAELSRLNPFVLVVSSLIASLCATPPILLAQQEASAQQQEKLNAFARTYGYVRFFHPSDQASLLDWSQMALYGANEVLNSPDDETTDELLKKIFGPVVVDLEFYRGDQKPLPETKEVDADEILAWQHSGVGIGRPGLYRSARTNRSSIEKAPVGAMANVLQAIDANELRGEEIRFRFRAKVDKACRLQGWFRVDRESEEKGLFDNMNDRPITKTGWAEYELSGTVDKDAELLTFGVMMFGQGSGLIDDAKLEVKDGEVWEEIEIQNPDFELGESSPKGWFGTVKGFDYVTETKDVAEGDQAMRIAVQTRTRAAKSSILPMIPKLGEVIDAEIAEGLRVRMPLCLPIDMEYQSGDDIQVDTLVKTVEAFSTKEEKVYAAANVAISWSVFQHFYPYFDQVQTDWDQVLVTSMKSAANSKDRASTRNCLRWLVAQLHDGHGNVVDRSEFARMRYLPVSFSWVEDQLVVIASNHKEVNIGDVVTTINGVKVADRLERDETLISGSPQWKRYRSVGNLSVVSDGAGEVTLNLKRGDTQWDLAIEPGTTRPPVPARRLKIDIIEEGKEDGSGALYYVDLGRVAPEDVSPMIELFAEAKGIVFDLRGYPNGTQFLFQHLTPSHLQSAKWLVPQQVRPDRVEMDNFDNRGRWQMPANTPQFKGKFAFITNGSAISYAESCMAIIANYKLAPIIGSPTAGANGNINPFQLPGGYTVIFTGMRVVNHDDSQHHVLGVQPTIPMEPTVEGIRNGKDELLEKAIEVVRE